MTSRADFTEDEWRVVLEGPTSAGMLVVTASKGGMFRETFAMSKAYAEARAEHGRSALLDAVVATNPKVEHVHAGSPEAAREHCSGSWARPPRWWPRRPTWRSSVPTAGSSSPCRRRSPPPTVSTGRP